MLDKLISSEYGFTVEKEFKFHPTRKWRFDFAIQEHKIAIESEGGIWSGGRHTRGKGFIGDMEKYNTATALGWRLIRIQTNDYSSAFKYLDLMLKN